MIMRSKELKTYNLPNDENPSSQINAKPTGLFVLLIILSILLLAMKASIAHSLMIIGISLVCVCFMPRVTLIEFYKEYFVLYNRADKSLCVLIYYSDVISWRYIWTAKKDLLSIELEDGSEEKIEAFSKTIFEAYMYKYLRDKHKKNK